MKPDTPLLFNSLSDLMRAGSSVSAQTKQFIIWKVNETEKMTSKWSQFLLAHSTNSKIFSF